MFSAGCEGGVEASSALPEWVPSTLTSTIDRRPVDVRPVRPVQHRTSLPAAWRARPSCLLNMNRSIELRHLFLGHFELPLYINQLE
ncbi:hypothetical protein PRIPAC_76213 [Pristionchus pacificus]|uniref:Uncharacterized protein n=1 Tax=Pristionchus pacificus TaxID=54126 RepID=A0A2A6BGL5_PRIPA|nr:hypothetical protein PRIPAC_76213 [Pristionchus pacificus]|eukprot:PDM64961.1 hypothetical protein PRIPAC_53217 [Pristionchus pacificus]